MQRTIRVNENQLIMLSERAHYDHSQAGYLHKRSADSTKWQLRWFVLYQVSNKIPEHILIRNIFVGELSCISVLEVYYIMLYHVHVLPSKVLLCEVER